MDRPEAGLRQRIFAWALARYAPTYERFAAPYKQQLLSDLAGTVLEIGPGTGINFRYLNSDDVRWIGVEPNLFMARYLYEEAARWNIAADLRIGTAESLPVPDASVDAVISTLVLCAVASQERVLQEVLRVLRPGGRFVFLEHVAAPRGSRLRRIQDLITPFWKRLGDGCHPNRETWVELERAGFARSSYERITGPTPIVSPQIAGFAMKREQTVRMGG